jgi:hypothetical protein
MNAILDMATQYCLLHDVKEKLFATAAVNVNHWEREQISHL